MAEKATTPKKTTGRKATTKKVTVPAPTKKATRPQVFFELLTSKKQWEKKELATAYHKAYGSKANPSESVFWVTAYCAVLLEAKVITVTNGTVAMVKWRQHVVHLSWGGSGDVTALFCLLKRLLLPTIPTFP